MTTTTESTTTTDTDFQVGQAVILTQPWTIDGNANSYMRARTRQGQVLEFRGLETSNSDPEGRAKVRSASFDSERLIDLSCIAKAEFAPGDVVDVMSYVDLELKETKRQTLAPCVCGDDSCSWLNDEEGGMVRRDGQSMNSQKVVVKISAPVEQAEPVRLPDLPVGTMLKDRDQDLWIKTGQNAFAMWGSATQLWEHRDDQVFHEPYSTEVTTEDLLNKNFASWVDVERGELVAGDLVEFHLEHDQWHNRSRHVAKVEQDGFYLVVNKEGSEVWEFDGMVRLVVGTAAGWGADIHDVKRLAKADLPPIAGSELQADQEKRSWTHEGVTYTEGDRVAIVINGLRHEGVLRTGGIYVPEALSMDLPNGSQALVFAWDGQFMPQSISKLEAPAEPVVEKTPEEVERDRMQNRISELERELVQAREAHQQDVSRIGERLIQESEDREWCSEYDSVISDLNGVLKVELPKRMRQYEVVVEVTYRITKTVEASEYDEAWELARDDFDSSDLTYESPDLTHIDTYEA